LEDESSDFSAPESTLLSSASISCCDNTSAQNILTDHLKKTLLSLEVEFGKSSISFNQLFKLKIGDVLTLDKRIGEEIKVSVEKKHMFNGVSGVVNNHKAVKITKRVDKRKK